MLGEIQKRYRHLAWKLHPDLHNGLGAVHAFKELGEAYGVLMDPEKRAKYDPRGVA